MSCICLQTNPINACTDGIRIASIANVSTAVNVYIENITTGRITMYETASDVNGVVSIVFTGNFNTNHLYKAYITLGSSNIKDTLTITIDGIETCCVNITPIRIVSGGVVLTSTIEILTTLGCEETDQSSSSASSYKQTAADYTVTPYITVVGVTDTSAVVTITLPSPTDYPVGQTLTIKDESGNASVNNIVIVGNIEGVTPHIINSDLGAINIYSNGIDNFYFESTI